MSDEAAEQTSGNNAFNFPDGSRYEGEWQEVDGVRKMQGHGTLVIGKDIFKGNFVADKMEGRGEFVSATGARYEGEFVSNEFSGEGKYFWTDGAQYNGEWRANKMHGKGKYVDPEGVEWEGQFFNGKFNNGTSCIALR